MNRLERADAMMSAAHRSIGQLRRYGELPYEVHPRSVKNLAATVCDDEEILIAALFHDILEDVTPKNPVYNLEWMTREFGPRVADYVVELTDVFTYGDWPNLNRLQRKQRERERYAAMSSGAKVVKLADIICNLNDTRADDEGFARMFISEKALCLPYLKLHERDEERLHVPLRQLFKQAQQVLRERQEMFA